ncbi:MAG: S1 RNA-binding domain-containing protein [bacterium]|nr:S1 RNA-binding domain-containing protein [bacterium]
MEELLSSTGYQFKGLKRGQTVVGKITQILSKAVLVDIGAKTEGIVGEREFEAARDFIKTLKVGDEISCQVYNPESDSGQILLSLKRTAFSSGWQQLLRAREIGDEVEVMVTQITRNGLIVEIYGLNGFIPNSQVGEIYQNRLGELIDRKIKVKVVEVDEAEGRLIFSEKAVSEKEKMEAVREALKKVVGDEEYEGVVSGVTPFGVFVQIQVEDIPVEGLAHISELSWEKVEDPNTILKVGEKVNVKVISKDEKTGRLALSLKQLTADPWLEQIAKHPLESQVTGKVSKLTAFGAFIEIEPNLTGLLHISKIPPEQKINVGDTVTCFVEAVEPDKRRLSLGLALKAKPVGYK